MQKRAPYSLNRLLPLFLFSALASCGRDTQQITNWDFNAPERGYAEALNKIQSPAFQATHLRLKGAVPGTVALSVLDITGEASFCTGSVISSRHILTNRHCIPMDLNTGSCSGRVFIAFPGVETTDPEFGFVHNRAVNCESINYLTKNIERQPEDLAILTLAEDVPPGTTIRAIQMRNLTDGEKVVVNRIQFVSGSAEGRWKSEYNYSSTDGGFRTSRALGGQLVVASLEALPCEIAEGSRYVPEHIAPASTRYGLNQCPVIGGNSGSLVTDATGAGVAVLHAKTGGAEIVRQLLLLAGVETDQLGPMGIAINLNCGSTEFINTLQQFISQPTGEFQECHSPTEPNLAAMRTNWEMERARDEFVRFSQLVSFREWRSSEGTKQLLDLGDLRVQHTDPSHIRNVKDILGVKIQNYAGQVTYNNFFLPTLSCIQRVDRILERTQKNFLFIKWQPTLASIPTPSIQTSEVLGAKIDSALRNRAKLGTGQLIKTEFEINPDQLKKTGTTPYQWKLQYFDGQQIKWATAPGGVLNTCP